MSRKSEIQDEADATVREGARTAALERERRIDEADHAKRALSDAARPVPSTLWQRIKRFFTGSES